MIPNPVNYDEHRQWGHSTQQGYYQDNRPYTEIVLYNPNSSLHKRIWALIDSGADFLQINKTFARDLGININNKSYSPNPIQTAGGKTVNVIEVPNLELEIEGKRIKKVKCLFGDNQIPILGRVTILTAIDFGFDAKGWLFKK